MATVTYVDSLAAASANVALAAATPVTVEALTPDLDSLRMQADTANTATVYLLLGTGIPSATNWHVALPAGAVWDGSIGDTVGYRGPVQAVCSATGRLAVAVS